MPNPIVHWEIAVKDGAKAKEFYSKLFGWKIGEPAMPAMMNYREVDTGGEGLNGGIFQPEGDVPNYVTIYVQVDNLQACLDKVQALGGRAIVPPTPIPEMGAFAMFMDPEGNVLGIWSK